MTAPANLLGRGAGYAETMDRLVAVVQLLSRARDLDAIAAIVRDAARHLTGADGATFVLRDGDRCHYLDENAISPLWKGRRFPMSACISGWTMLHRRSVVIEDIYADPRIPADAYRPTFVKSLAMVPIRSEDPIGAIGNYWATHRRPSAQELSILQALADTTSVALENAQLYGQLQERLRTLEEKEVRIREQRDALDVFTRALAHDLREPVRTVHSFAELLERPSTTPGAAREYVGFLRRASERMKMLIETVSLYTQLDDPRSVRRETVSLDAVLREVREDLTSSIEERRATVTSDPLPEVRGNPAQIRQVLQNLVSNAVRHGGDGVRVHVGGEARGDHWVVSVGDDGPGIPLDRLEIAFQPFRRLTHARDCAGLGLAICRKVVGLHGGKIWYEPAAGGGARLLFTLPRAGGAAPTEGPAAPPTTAATGQGEGEAPSLASVLVVDDMESDVELLRMLLFERGGYECEYSVARDGSEALRLLENASRRGRPFDLVLLDINMPAMDGFETLERLRGDDELRDTVVVMCTGSSSDEDRRRAASLGAAGYIVKPPTREAVREALERVETLDVLDGGGAPRLVRVPRGPAPPPIRAAG